MTYSYSLQGNTSAVFDRYSRDMTTLPLTIINEETNTVRRRLVVRTKTYMLLKNSLSQDVGVVVHVTSNPDVYFCSHVYGGSYEFVSLSGQNVSIISSSIHGP